MSFCIERASSNMHAEPVPQRAILVGMALGSFVNWYANLYSHTVTLDCGLLLEAGVPG